jgi:hypothetical protein
MNDFSEAKVGDRVWNIGLGWGTINNIIKTHTTDYPIAILFDCGEEEEFTKDGRFWLRHKHPTLFWDEVKIIPPPRPKRKVKKVVEGWIFLWPDTCSNVVAAASSVYPTKEEAERVCVKNDALGPPCFIRHEYEIEE